MNLPRPLFPSTGEPIIVEDGDEDITSSSGEAHPMAASTPDPLATSDFLSNLFDPSIVDPSLTGGKTTVSNRPNIFLHQTLNNSDSNGTVSGGYNPDLEYEHDIYFILVIVTVSLTLFVLVVFSVYRVVEACFDQQERRQELEAPRLPPRGTPRIPREVVGSPGTQRREPASSHERRYRSVEVLTNFFSGPFGRAAPTTVLSASVAAGAHPPNLRTPRSKRHRDAPPPYDDPPPYHIAISMISTMSSDDAEDEFSVENVVGKGEEAASAEEQLPSAPPMPQEATSEIEVGSEPSQRGSSSAVNSICSRTNPGVVV